MTAAPSRDALAARLVEDGALAESSQTLAGMILDRLAYNESGTATVLTPAGFPSLDDNGQPVTVASLVEGSRKDLPMYWSKSTAAKREASTDPRYGQPRTADEKAEETLATATTTNPWSRSSWSVTRQIFVTANDPDVAVKMQREAGQ